MTKNPTIIMTWKTLGHDFHVPHLVGIADGKRLAVAAVTVFLDQVRHDFDGFTRRAAAFQGDKHQADLVHNAGGVNEIFAATESGLAESDLIFIDIT